MQKMKETWGTVLTLIEANVKRKIIRYSNQLGVGIDRKFRFSKESTNGHVLIGLLFFDAENSKDSLDGDELESASQAEINLNYHVELLDGIVYSKDNEQLIWQYIYPQVKVDVALYCISIGLPNFTMPNDFSGR